MKLLVVLLAAAVASSTAGAAQTLRSVSWTDLGAAGQLQNGRVLPGGELDVEANDGAEATLPIFELQKQLAAH